MPFHTFITWLRRPIFSIYVNRFLPHSTASQRILACPLPHKKEVTFVALIPGFAVAVGINHLGSAVLPLVPCCPAETGMLPPTLGPGGIDPIQDVFR